MLRILEYAKDKDFRIVDFDGHHLGFLQRFPSPHLKFNGLYVYNYDGDNVGFLEKGILRDLQGNCVGFGKNVTDYPIPLLPYKQQRPQAFIPGLLPLKPYPNLPNISPIKRFSWSLLDPI
jgi:hypothetical protein